MTSPVRQLLHTSTQQLKRAIASVRYSWQRDRLESAYRNRSRVLHDLVNPAFVSAIATPQGGCFNFQDVKLTIEFITLNTVRIHWWTKDETRFYQAVDTEPEHGLAQLIKTATGWELATPELRIEIAPDGCLDFYDGEHRLIRQEYPPQQQLAAGEPQLERGWLHRAKLQPSEHIYGLGERAQPLDLRQAKTTYRMWNTDPQGKYKSGQDPLYISIPVYIGCHPAGSYLVFYENPYDGMFEFDEEAIVSFDGGSLRYYVSVGTMPELVNTYTELTGRPALPPRWAFGYHHCRWGYDRESALRETAAKMVAHDLPLQAMHLDIDCLDDFRPFTIATDRFPTLTEFIAESATQGIRLILIVHPSINAKDSDPLFQAGVAANYFCTDRSGTPIIAPLWAGDSGYVDFTNPAARAWWSEQFQQLIDMGFSGFWHDMNEPATATLWGDPTLPPHTTYHDFAGAGGNHLAAHNLAGLQQTQAGYERLRQIEPDKRPFILTRSGWAGTQKYAWTWTGDSITSWSSLRQTIPMVLNLGLSGIPYSGPDIGGFVGNPSPELYLRWFQLSCFLPFCRTHGSKKTKPRVPWNYGDRVLDIVRDFLNIRRALLPYLYTLAWESTQSGAPLVRPLCWDTAAPMSLWAVDDTFCLGDALLIAPIVIKGQQTRSIPLPPGDWYEFWSDRYWTEQPQITVPITLDRIPILVKAGSILPMEAAEMLSLHCYPDRTGNCTGSLYSDALDGYGTSRIDKFELRHHDGKWQLHWESEGEFPFPYDAIQFTIYGIDLEEVHSHDLPIDFALNIFTIEPFQSLVFTGELRSVVK
jgi:alpha-glucosidase